MTEDLSTINNTGNLLLYQTEDGLTRIEVKIVNDTVWLTQMQMAELFQKDKRTISEHVNNVFADKELKKGATVRKFRTVQLVWNQRFGNHQGIFYRSSSKPIDEFLPAISILLSSSVNMLHSFSPNLLINSFIFGEI